MGDDFWNRLGGFYYEIIALFLPGLTTIAVFAANCWLAGGGEAKWLDDVAKSYECVKQPTVGSDPPAAGNACFSGYATTMPSPGSNPATISEDNRAGGTDESCPNKLVIRTLLLGGGLLVFALGTLQIWVSRRGPIRSAVMRFVKNRLSRCFKKVIERMDPVARECGAKILGILVFFFLMGWNEEYHVLHGTPLNSERDRVMRFISKRSDGTLENIPATDTVVEGPRIIEDWQRFKWSTRGLVAGSKHDLNSTLYQYKYHLHRSLAQSLVLACWGSLVVIAMCSDLHVTDWFKYSLGGEFLLVVAFLDTYLYYRKIHDNALVADGLSVLLSQPAE